MLRCAQKNNSHVPLSLRASQANANASGAAPPAGALSSLAALSIAPWNPASAGEGGAPSPGKSVALTMLSMELAQAPKIMTLASRRRQANNASPELVTGEEAHRRHRWPRLGLRGAKLDVP